MPIPAELTLFVAGDVMLGRGVDQILPHPSDPSLHEPHVDSAIDYVRLAESANGPLPKKVGFAYPWGEGLAILERLDPDVRIINLETSITRQDTYWTGKNIHYRMHPHNLPILTRAGIDCCVLANNHVMDWGREGLRETLRSLESASIQVAGAGCDREQARHPAILEPPAGGRILVQGLGHPSSGIPTEWAAGDQHCGVNLRTGDPRRIAAGVRRVAAAHRQPGDLLVASLHWGDNWGFEITGFQRELAHALVEDARVDLVHGHSSHHVKAIEVHRGKPILYGCGDLLNDYEGIQTRKQYHGERGLMYFPTLDTASGDLVRFRLVPTRIRRFRITRGCEDDVRWLREVLDRESEPLGVHVDPRDDNTLELRWA